MPLGLVRNRSMMRRGRRLVTNAAPTTGCVCCAGPCAIPCAMAEIAPGTTAAVGYLTAYAACPDCIPGTVRMTVTGLVPCSQEMIAFRAIGSFGGGGGTNQCAAFLKPISGTPTSFDVCLSNHRDRPSGLFPGGYVVLWGRYALPLAKPFVAELWVDAFPEKDEDDCIIYNPARATRVCTVTSTHFTASFGITPGGVGTFSTGSGHDLAGFSISTCFNIPAEDIDECIRTFPDPEHPGDPDLAITVDPSKLLGNFLFLRTPPPDPLFPPTEVFDFCGAEFTFRGATESEWRAAVAASIAGLCDQQVDALLNGITYGGTVRVKPCCVLKPEETCSGDVTATETWYQGRRCNGTLTPLLAAPNWVDLDSGEAYFDGSILTCVTFSSADTVEVPRGQFPWSEGYQPFYVPVATLESCAASVCGGGTCPTDNSECDDTYIGTFTPGGSGGAPCGEASPKVGTLTPDGDGTWSWEQFPETQPGFYQMELYCEDGFQYAKVFDLVEEGGFSITFRKALSGGPCPPTGEYAYFSGGPAGCDLTGSTFSLAAV